MTCRPSSAHAACRTGLVRRAQMIRWSEEGMPLAEIGRRLKVTQPAISNWRRRFREQRLSGLHDQLKAWSAAHPKR